MLPAVSKRTMSSAGAVHLYQIDAVFPEGGTSPGSSVAATFVPAIVPDVAVRAVPAATVANTSFVGAANAPAAPTPRIAIVNRANVTAINQRLRMVRSSCSYGAAGNAAAAFSASAFTSAGGPDEVTSTSKT